MEVELVEIEKTEAALGDLGGALEDIADELRGGNVVMEGPQELARVAVCRRHGGNLGAILTQATLASDIVQAIAEAREPSGLSLEKVTKGLPTGWEEQRERRRQPNR